MSFSNSKTSLRRAIVSVLVCICIIGEIATPAYAAASSYMNDTILGNVTRGGVYEDVTNNAQYLYGGNVVFKFRDSARGVPPVFSFAPPKIKSGCNGISFTGGFLQVLGLDGLADQIQNAGTAVVYGIIVGLIYSLPALEKVFSHIRQWAEWLQNMLKSACAQGMNLGEQMGKKSGLSNPLGGISNDFESLFDAGDKKGMGILAAPKSVTGNELADLMKSVSSGAKDGADANEKKSARGKTAVNNYIEYYREMGIANIILNELKLPLNTDVPWAKEVILPSGELEELYTIVVNIFGDISIDDESIAFIEQHNSYMQSMVSTGTSTGATPQEELRFSQMAGASATVGVTEPLAPMVRLQVRHAPMNPERAARFFVFGSSEGDTTKMELLKPTILKAQTKRIDGTGYSKMLFTASISEDQKADIQWKGLFETAKAKIDCKITEQVSGTPCANAFPLVLPGARNFISAIKKIEINEARRQGIATGGKISAQSSALRDDFAQHEAFFYAKFMLNFIESEIVKSKEKMKGADLSALLQFERNFRERKKEIQEHMSKIITEDGAMIDALVERFKRVDDALKKESVKGYN